MKKITKNKDIRDSSHLVHLWANKRLDDKEYTKGGFLAEGNSLYYHSSLIAIHYPRYTFIKRFNNRGAFGNGFCDYDVIRAIPKDKKYYLYYKLPTDNLLDNKDAFLNWFKNEYIIECDYFFNNIAGIKEFISNNRRRSDRFTLEFDHCLPPAPSDLIPPTWYKRFKGAINNIQVKQIGLYNFSTSWGRCNTDNASTTIECKIKDLYPLNISKFLNQTEIDEFNFKVWYLRHRDYPYCFTVLNRNTAREIYNNPAAKLVREDLCRAGVKRKDELEKEKLRNKHKDDITNYINALEKWKSSDNSDRIKPYIYGVDVYDSIKLVKDKVITSQRVMIDIVEAKLAYRYFKQHDTPHTPEKEMYIAGWRVIGLVDRDLHVIKDNRLVGKTSKCIIVGCHIIPDFEIEDFIVRYKLDW